MNNNTIRTIFTAAIIVFIFAIAIKILSSAIRFLLPIAIIIIAGYIIYSLITGRRIR